MSFTYSDALTAVGSKIRLAIGDTVENKGPRPDKRNYTDNEIAYFYAAEDDRLNGAIANAYEHLAAEWTAYALSEREGNVSIDATKVADLYTSRAILWRAKPGGASTVARSGFAATLTRTDAYTDD